MVTSPRPRVVAIMQARMGSTRLPGKVLLDLAGEPMLARDVARVRRARTLDELVVATTTEPADDAIVALCAARGWACFRGSEADVLDRYYQAARAYQAEVVVRLTGDNPLTDPGLIDQVVGEFLAGQPNIDYACNRRPQHTFPLGLDTEVMRFDALAVAWQEDHNPAWREHVTPFILRQPERFRLHSVQNSVDQGAMRWTVDSPEDLAFVRKIYEHFQHDRFTWHEVLAVVAAHPEWEDLNRQVPQKAAPA